jgi:hypothetical protein
LEEETMSASTHRIPHVPPDLLPLLEDCVGRPEGHVPIRRTPEDLVRLREGLDTLAEDYGIGSPVYNRFLLVLAMEYSRAEVIP